MRPSNVAAVARPPDEGRRRTVPGHNRNGLLDVAGLGRVGTRTTAVRNAPGACI